MAAKEEILEQISVLAEREQISRDKLIRAYDAGRSRSAPDGSSVDLGAVSAVAPPPLPPAAPAVDAGEPLPLMKRIGIAEILFYVGGAIVFLGLVFLIGQNWETLGVLPRLLATMGAGIAAYYVGFALERDEKTRMASPAFFLISALITPMGLYVILDSAGVKASGYGYQTIISGTMLAAFAASFFAFRKSIFLLFSIFYGTWLFFSVTSYLLISGPGFDQFNFYAYRALAAGLAYLFLAHALARTGYAPISGFLNNFGLIGFFGAALALGGTRPNTNVFWVVFYPGFVFGALFLSVHLKSKAYLAWGSIFLVIYLIKTGREYFPTGMGWPTVLVMIGLTLIGVGYMYVSLKRKYFLT